MQNPDELISKLEEKKQKLDAQIKSIKAKNAKAERKSMTRKKVLLGAFLMNQMEIGKYDKDTLTKELDGFLTRPKDRALFGLSNDK